MRTHGQVQVALSSGPSLILVPLITRLTILVLAVPSEHHTLVFILGWLSTVTRVRVRTNASDYADLCPGIPFANRRGVGEVYEFNNSKYRRDVPTPLRPELKIKCAFII